MKQTVDPIVAELLKLKRNGQIKPEDVVEAAESEDSSLHSWFEWTDSKAAQEYRLWQARQLIRTRVTIITKTSVPMRVFVNLTSERADGNGYREIVSVMKDKTLRGLLLEDAFDDMERFKSKYIHLKELAGVFAAMAKVSGKKSKKAARLQCGIEWARSGV